VVNTALLLRRVDTTDSLRDRRLSRACTTNNSNPWTTGNKVVVVVAEDVWPVYAPVFAVAVLWRNAATS